MRIMYTGMDNRVRVCRATRVKFMDDGFQRTDKNDERDEEISGPIIIAHVDRQKGGMRLTLQAPDNYDMGAARTHLLQYDYLDLTMCTVKGENLY